MAAAKTVLVIDDDPDIVQSLRLVLQRRGYRVISASDGNAGLAVAERDGPDLVIVDMMMPKKSGFLVIEKLRQRSQDTPRIIMVTANEGSRHRAYAEMLGVNAYIRKPFSFDQILEAAERLCPLAPPPTDKEGTSS